jgi:hypothetical protein
LCGIALVALVALADRRMGKASTRTVAEALQASATILLIVVTAIYVGFSGHSVSLARESLELQLHRIETAKRPYDIPVPTRQCRV